MNTTASEAAPDFRVMNREVIAEYRRRGGLLSGPLQGMPVLLLTTTGRRSGQRHTTPLGYVEHGDRLLVAASAAGAPTDPDWFRNLAAAPEVTVEVGTAEWFACAEVLADAERDRAFDLLKATLPGLADYAAATDRRIPVVALAPGAPDRRCLADTAERLRSMHVAGDPLVLVNVWDVASARRVEAAGAQAVATSSAAVAASLGVPDDPTAPVPLLFEALARIVGAVAVPVTADLLDGYGLPADELVDRLVAAGAVGCNIEDSDHAQPGRLLDPEVVAERLAAVRVASHTAGVELVVNARIDTLLNAGGQAADDPAIWADIVQRARRYLDAGADCVYPIRLTEPQLVRRLVAEVGGPVNANLAPGGTVADMAEAGASRISIGPTAHRASLAALDTLATTLLAPG